MRHAEFVNTNYGVMCLLLKCILYLVLKQFYNVLKQILMEQSIIIWYVLLLVHEYLRMPYTFSIVAAVAEFPLSQSGPIQRCNFYGTISDVFDSINLLLWD